MKKFILTLIFLILFISISYSEEPKGFFGINLYEDAKNFYTTSYIEENKEKKRLSLKPFFFLNVGSNIPNKSVYFDNYAIYLDDKGIIHGILGSKYATNYENCKESLPFLIEGISNKYNVDFIDGRVQILFYHYIMRLKRCQRIK